MLQRLREFVRAIWAGPLRTRVFWLLIFKAVVDFTEGLCVEFGSACFDLVSYQPIVDQIVNFLVLVGILHATRRTIEVDDVDVAWSRESLARKSAARGGPT